MFTRVPLLALATGLALGASACGFGQVEPCEPGERVSCTCEDGAFGTRTCADDGKRWGACECAGAPDGGAGDGGGVRDGGGSDGGGVDAGPVCPLDADCTGRDCGLDPVCGVSCGSCNLDQTCVAGVCGAQCTTVADCALGEVCDGGGCRFWRSSDECAVDGDCPRDHRCEPSTSLCVGCQAHADCAGSAGGSSCDLLPDGQGPGVGYCYTRSCATDTDCDPGRVCIALVCEACTAAADCEAGLVCGPDGLCAGPAADECIEGGTTLRRIQPAGVGDLEISEYLANPSAAADAEGEWLEVRVRRDVDLNGLELGRDATGPVVLQTLASADCLTAAAGDHVVLARSLDPALNGGLPVVDHLLEMALYNSASGVFVGVGGAVIDAVGWTSVTAGVAESRDPGDGSWCPATAPYGDGDRGTPGAANPACPLIPPPGSCVEGGTTIRLLDPPAAGDLLITEIMANPVVVSDADGEWFEVRVERDLDLNGLQLGTDPVAATVRQTVDDTACLRVLAGTHLLFARELDAAVNGLLPAPDHAFSFGVINTGGGLFVGHGGAILDQVTWATSIAGAASSRDPSGAPWCAAVDPYGADGNLGTPGAANPSCP